MMMHDLVMQNELSENRFPHIRPHVAPLCKVWFVGYVVKIGIVSSESVGVCLPRARA
jgi:hypothetical protein